MMWEKELKLLGVKRIPKTILDRARLLKKLQKKKPVEKKEEKIGAPLRTWGRVGEGW